MDSIERALEEGDHPIKTNMLIFSEGVLQKEGHFGFDSGRVEGVPSWRQLSSQVCVLFQRRLTLVLLLLLLLLLLALVLLPFIFFTLLRLFLLLLQVFLFFDAGLYFFKINWFPSSLTSPCTADILFYRIIFRFDFFLLYRCCIFDHLAGRPFCEVIHTICIILFQEIFKGDIRLVFQHVDFIFIALFLLWHHLLLLFIDGFLIVVTIDIRTVLVVSLPLLSCFPAHHRLCSAWRCAPLLTTSTSLLFPRSSPTLLCLALRSPPYYLHQSPQPTIL